MLEHPVGRMLDTKAMLAVLNEEHGLDVTYRRLWGAAVERRIPAYRTGRTLQFAEGDVPTIIGHFRPHRLRAA